MVFQEKRLTFNSLEITIFCKLVRHTINNHPFGDTRSSVCTGQLRRIRLLAWMTSLSAKHEVRSVTCVDRLRGVRPFPRIARIGRVRGLRRRGFDWSAESSFLTEIPSKRQKRKVEDQGGLTICHRFRVSRDSYCLSSLCDARKWSLAANLLF